MDRVRIKTADLRSPDDRPSLFVAGCGVGPLDMCLKRLAHEFVEGTAGLDCRERLGVDAGMHGVSRRTVWSVVLEQ